MNTHRSTDPIENQPTLEAPTVRAEAAEGAAVLMMLQLGIPAQEVADWTMDARRRREAMDRES
jgi:hypothetical protein